ncbi:MULTISPECIES: MarR family winged helix-turn-helix transcriptional regulator [unclassified Bradyrhizobium]|uniref:MarR family winged helix-turn-helix transcriptional regulator n=1 Tax=unclassified Bradyrhizobium TaxID=2631580 RepID=UPI0024E063B9|nr:MULTISPECIES: MarR family winged helix-turn-helix transcriptional regulator [unclassified Bradyrhizobium]
MTVKRTPVGDFLAMRAQTWPEAVTPTAELMVRIYRLSSLVLDQSRAQAAAHGLGFTEFEVLVTLRGQPAPHELLPTDLYGAILISSGGLTKVLHGLQARGLIGRGQSKDDRRSKPVRLTAKGRALAERAMRDVLSADDKLVHGALSASELTQLIRLVGKLLHVVEPGGPDSNQTQLQSPGGKAERTHSDTSGRSSAALTPIKRRMT